MYKRHLLGICFLLGTIWPALAQYPTVSLESDTAIFHFPQNRLTWKGQDYFYFEPATAQSELLISVKWPDMNRVLKVDLLSSPDFMVTDSLRLLEDGSATGRVRFEDLKRSVQPRMVFSLLMKDSSRLNRSLRLYPFFPPTLSAESMQVELFQDEEKVINLPIQEGKELYVSGAWQQYNGVSYRLFREGEAVKLALRANRQGRRSLSIPLRTLRPYLNDTGLPTQDVGTVHMDILVQTAPLSYLNLDTRDVFFEPMGQGATLIQLDRLPGLRLERTYRVENQEGPGGRLIAEIFTRSVVENQQKVLAVMRTYALHREEEGYLYLKDGDQTRFFTNFNILSKPKLEKVSLLRPGQDWNSSLTVFPGETLEVKLEGEGLEKAKFTFGEGRYTATLDTTRISDYARYYTLEVPLGINETRMALTMNGKPTRFDLLVREHQRAHDLNFVQVDYGEGNYNLMAQRFDKPATHEGEVRDVTVSFRRHMLDDDEGGLHGIQNLSIEVRVTGPDKRLIEIREINDIKVVPSPISPRYSFYDKSKATEGVIRLNDYLANKTYDWKPWTQVEITVKHKDGTPGGQTRKITLIPSQSMQLQLEVSFPAGLYTKKFNEAGLGTLSGISTAALVQASFYQPNRINKMSPWKVGGGFLALNALSSLTDGNDDKDLGVLGMVSFYPINSDSKVKFPLHAGLGYLFKSNTLFVVIGPGVQVNF